MRDNGVGNDQPSPQSGWQIAIVGFATLVLASAGALTFAVLERDAAMDSKAKYAQQLAALFEEGNFSPQQRDVVERMLSHHGDHWCLPHMTADDPWSFKGSLYFTLVLISTVGYGDLAPETTAGKVAAFVISAVGIPLMLSFTVPLSRRLVGALAGAVRRMYITHAVSRAMDAVELSMGGLRARTNSGKIRVDYKRRLPCHKGVGLSQHDLWQVELWALSAMMILIAVAIAACAALLTAVEGWTLEDSDGNLQCASPFGADLLKESGRGATFIPDADEEDDDNVDSANEYQALLR
eukprot:TRINITY_DN24120_c0_g1_i1.p1 TRINITY_DN24120_c0_g1~~TRINITY_DN24120_c0_g1_i1.p1  ORF type:complete len:295 (+),score=65.89 TRINITY_DN24120_c0_g1_i1:79-963(+)